MKKWKLALVIGIVIVVVAVGAYLLLLAGPKYTESDLVGTWVNKHNLKENLVLEPDGTFELHVYEIPEYLPPLTVTGVWWIKESDTLMLEAKIEIGGFSIGETASAKIKGNETLELHDEEGKIWVKQKKEAGETEGIIPGGREVLSADVNGAVIDTNSAAADNYVNGNVRIDIKIMSDDVDDVLSPGDELKVTVYPDMRATWSAFTIDLADSGATEADYGEVIKVSWDDSGQGTGDDDIWYKMDVPTTTDGEVDEGMAIHIYLKVQGGTAYDDTYWGKRETINLDVAAARDALTLTGFDGAHLFGIEDDSEA